MEDGEAILPPPTSTLACCSCCRHWSENSGQGNTSGKRSGNKTPGDGARSRARKRKDCRCGKKQEKHRRATKQSHPGGVPSSLKISPHSSIHFFPKSINGCKCKIREHKPNLIAKSIQILTRSIMQPYCGTRSKAPARPGFTHLSMNCIF